MSVENALSLATTAVPASDRHPAQAAAVHAEPIAIHARATAEQAFIAIGVACLRHCASNQAGVLSGNSEALHQMRVGLRRLRAALSLFKPLFAVTELAATRTSLRWLTGELGLARDYDVFLTASPESTAFDNASGSAGGNLRAALIERRQQAFEQARQAVGSERAQTLIRELAVWFVCANWAAAANAAQAALRVSPAPVFAQAALERRTKRIRKRVRRLASLPSTERHRLRVAVKKLRYGTEFFETLVPGSERRRKRFTRRLEALQDLLGKLNDLTVQRRLAAELAASDQPRAFAPEPGPGPGSCGSTAAAKADGEAALLEAAVRRGQRFAHSLPFWS